MHTSSQNKNALKRNSKFQKVCREPLAGGKRQRNGSELVSKQLPEHCSRRSRGLAVNKQEGIDDMSVPIESMPLGMNESGNA